MMCPTVAIGLSLIISETGNYSGFQWNNLIMDVSVFTYQMGWVCTRASGLH